MCIKDRYLFNWASVYSREGRNQSQQIFGFRATQISELSRFDALHLIFLQNFSNIVLQPFCSPFGSLEC